MSIKPIQKTSNTGEYVIDRDSSDNILKIQGTTVPTDGTSWFAKWCVYLKTDTASWNVATYTNKWTTTSCAFSVGWTPWLVVYQETVAFWDMTDVDATWTIELSTTIPKGAVVVQSLIDDVTWFIWDTSAVVTIWDGTDVDRYNTGTPNVFADADTISAGAISWTAFHAAAKTPTVIVTTDADFTSVTAGAMTITIMYYLA